MTKHLHKIMFVELAILAFFMGLACYWLFIEPDVITVMNSESIQLDKTSYKSGDRIIYTISFCKTKDVPVTIYRALVDTYRIQYEEITVNLSKGCRTISVADLAVPNFLGGDKHEYYIEANNVLRVNPLRNQIVHWKSVPFTVE